MCVDKHALLHKMTCVFGKEEKNHEKIPPTLKRKEPLSLLWGNTVHLDSVLSSGQVNIN